MNQVKFYARNFRMFLLLSVALLAALLLLKNNLIARLDAANIKEVSGVAQISLTNEVTSKHSNLQKILFTIEGETYVYLQWFPRFETVLTHASQEQTVKLEYGPAYHWIYSLSIKGDLIVPATEVQQAIRKNNLINLPLSLLFFLFGFFLIVRLQKRKKIFQKEQSLTDKPV